MKSQIVQIILFLALLTAIFFGVHATIEAKQADGFCMEPHIYDGDIFMVVKAAYWFESPARGNVIVFHYPLDPSREFVKRIIGLPGETIECKSGVVYVDSKPLEEPYVSSHTNDFSAVTVPNGEYFVMGDNRQNSEDSRVWGCLPRDDIVGRACFVYWPFKDLHLLHGYSYSTK